MRRSPRIPLATAVVLLLLGACSSPPGAHENVVPPGVSLEPARPVQPTGGLVLPGVTPAAAANAAADTSPAPAAAAPPAAQTAVPADSAAARDTMAGRTP